MSPKKTITLLLAGCACISVLAACSLLPTPEPITIIETVIVEKIVTQLVEVEVMITATPVPPTPTPIPPTPTPEPTIYFHDDFELEDLMWNTADNERVERFIEGGNYHILVKEPYNMAWSSHPELDLLEDFRLEVDITQVAGPEIAVYGVLFRHQNAQNWYAFLISGNGLFSLRLRENDEMSPILNFRRSSSIRPAGSTNHLSLEVVGQQISMYANDELLAMVPDTAFARGDIRLFAWSQEESPIEILFDNLKVSALE